MEQEKTILTDEQIEAITKELGDAASPTTENLRKIMAEGEHDDDEYPKRRKKNSYEYNYTRTKSYIR